MLRIVVAVACAAGCLSEPDLPPGHSPELRKETLVADIDGDGKDDLVMWGHTADPRHEADLFIRWGGRTPGAAPDLTVPLAIEPGASWHEILDVTFVTSTRDATRELLVLSGEDRGPPPDGVPSRHVYQTTITFAGHQVDKITPSADFVSKSNLGGYAGAETYAFVRAHDTLMGGQVHVLHGSDSVFFDHGLPLATSTATFVEAKLTDRDAGEKVQGVYTLLPTVEGHEDYLVATDHRVAITTGDAGNYGFGAQHALPESLLRKTRGRTLASATWLAGASLDDTTVPLVRVAPASSFAIDYVEVAAAHSPDDIALLQFLTHSDIDVIALEGSELAAYENVSVATGQHDPRIATDAMGGDILVVGHFIDGDDEILLFSSANPLAAPACFRGAQLAPC